MNSFELTVLLNKQDISNPHSSERYASSAPSAPAPSCQPPAAPAIRSLPSTPHTRGSSARCSAAVRSTRGEDSRWRDNVACTPNTHDGTETPPPKWGMFLSVANTQSSDNCTAMTHHISIDGHSPLQWDSRGTRLTGRTRRVSSCQTTGLLVYRQSQEFPSTEIETPTERHLKLPPHRNVPP